MKLLTAPSLLFSDKSEIIFSSNVSSKEQTKEFNLSTMRLVFIRFVEEIEDTKKTFQN